MVNQRVGLVLLLALCNVAPSGHAEGADRVSILAEQFWPYSFASTDEPVGAPIGINVTFARELLTAAGIEYDVSLLPWPRLMKYVREEPDQLVVTLVRSAEREDLVHWIGPVAKVEHALYGLGSVPGPRPTTLEEARSASVATVFDDVAHDYLVAQGFERVINTSGYLKGLEMLLRGRVDLYPGNSALIEYQCSQIALECEDLELVLSLSELEQDLYFAMSRGTDDATVARVRSAFDALVASGRLEEIRAQFLRSP